MEADKKAEEILNRYFELSKNNTSVQEMEQSFSEEERIILDEAMRSDVFREMVKSSLQNKEGVVLKTPNEKPAKPNKNNGPK